MSVVDPDVNTGSAAAPLRGMAAALREWGAVSLRSRGVRAGLLAPKKQILSGRLARAPRRLSVRRERATL